MSRRSFEASTPSGYTRVTLTDLRESMGDSREVHHRFEPWRRRVYVARKFERLQLCQRRVGTLSVVYTKGNDWDAFRSHLKRSAAGPAAHETSPEDNPSASSSMSTAESTGSMSSRPPPAAPTSRVGLQQDADAMEPVSRSARRTRGRGMVPSPQAPHRATQS